MISEPDARGRLWFTRRLMGGMGAGPGAGVFVALYEGIICVSPSPVQFLSPAGDFIRQTRARVGRAGRFTLSRRELNECGLAGRRSLCVRVWADEINVA